MTMQQPKLELSIQLSLTDGHVLLAQLNNTASFLVKRCYYLEANEKLVLFELYSWAKNDGTCKIAMDLVSLKLGISERTVRTCVKKLAKKMFVQVSKQGRLRAIEGLYKD